MGRLNALYQMELPHRAIAVYGYLADRAIKDLRKAGVIETEQRFRTKGGKSSLLYKIKT